MKEAAGEANLTIITIILIGVILTVGTIIVNGVMDQTKRKTCCLGNGGEWSGAGQCVGASDQC